jgi:hypothetical protein
MAIIVIGLGALVGLAVLVGMLFLWLSGSDEDSKRPRE